MKSTAEFFESLAKIITGIALITLILGYYQLVIFYSYFGISINSYINVSEIIISSIGTLLYVFVGLISTTIVLYGRIQNLTPENANETARKMSWIPLKYLYIIAFILLYGSLLIIQRFSTNTPLYVFAVINILLWILFIPANLGVLLYQPFGNYFIRYFKFPQLALLSVVFIILFLIYSTFYEYLKYTGYISKTNVAKIELYFKDNTKVVSDSTEKYIGKTQDYYFFYNLKTNATEIFSKSEIIKSVIHPTE